MNMVSGIIDTKILFLLVSVTFLLLLIAFKKVHNSRARLALVLMVVSVFFYSGYGISYIEVPDKYVSKFFIFVLCLIIPFVFLSKHMKETNKYSEVDLFLLSRPKILRYISILYIICLFIPLIYPEFKLFDFFRKSFNGLIGFYDIRILYRSNPLIVFIDAFKMFVEPFFMAYITKTQIEKPASKKPILLFLLVVLLNYMRYSYLSRYQMIVYATLLFLLIFAAKGFKFNFKIKYLIVMMIMMTSAIPFLYAFLFIRTGDVYSSNTSFSQITKLLIDSEAYYPIYYDHILSSHILQGHVFSYILWLFCLPIPSFLWPGKPKVESDLFTYSLTGMHYTDNGYSSSLPSALGDAFIYFGGDFYWLQGLLIGLIFAGIIIYLQRHRTMMFFSIWIIVYCVTLGRAGSISYLSTLINGVVPVFILDLYLHLKKNNYKQTKVSQVKNHVHKLT